MDLQLKEKVVVVTGGGSGIGLAAALEFAREGARVAICGRSEERLADAGRAFAAEGLDGRLFSRTCDVTVRTDVVSFADAVAEAVGPIDIWVNNAGSNKIMSLVDFEDEDIEELVGINLKSFLICTSVAARHMCGRGGVIINASSFAAIMPNAGRGLYSACKEAVLNLTRTYAAELAADGIRVVAYIPGQIETAMTQRAINALGLERLIGNIPMRRLGQPEELAKPIVFLASPAAGYINGSAIEVTGAKFSVQNPEYAWKDK